MFSLSLRARPSQDGTTTLPGCHELGEGEFPGQFPLSELIAKGPRITVCSDRLLFAVNTRFRGCVGDPVPITKLKSISRGHPPLRTGSSSPKPCALRLSESMSVCER